MKNPIRPRLENMNPPKCKDSDYIDFLIASPFEYTAAEAAKVHPETDGPAHDAYTRLLHRTLSDGDALWAESREFVNKKAGTLVLDDSTLDKPHAEEIELVTWHWSGNHKEVVKGINLISLLWTDEGERIPCDFRVYNRTDDGLTKNDHFQDMLAEAQRRGFSPDMVVFDSWYSSLANLKLLRKMGWDWLGALKGNRHVDPDGGGYRAISKIHIPQDGREVRLKGYGQIKVFRTAAKNGGHEHFGTGRLDMTADELNERVGEAWNVEVYHRGLKQFTGIEKCQHRKEIAQRNHIGLSIRAFLRLEVHRLAKGISWFNAKMSIIRNAVSRYLKDPHFKLSLSTA